MKTHGPRMNRDRTREVLDKLSERRQPIKETP